MSKLTKQVIVVRTDLRMRRGKEIAQGSHAADAWLRERVQGRDQAEMSAAERDWLLGDHRRVVCRVDSERELLFVHDAAVRAGLRSVVAVDRGLTEVEEGTFTALAVGPDFDENIDPVTKHLRLY